MRKIISLFRKDKCDVCNDTYYKKQLLYDEDLKICQSCAQHMNDISMEEN